MFGFQIPFNVHTCASAMQCFILTLTLTQPLDAAVLLIGGQVTTIMRFFLRRNMAIARDRAWTYTVESRGKGPDFWQPYIEEWDQPPPITSETSSFDKIISTWLGRFVLKRSRKYKSPTFSHH